MHLQDIKELLLMLISNLNGFHSLKAEKSQLIKTLFFSSFILIISLGICNAQTSTVSSGKLNARTESITSNLKTQLGLSPVQEEKVKNLYQESLQQIQQVVESNNGNKSVASDQIQTLIQQRETVLQTILTPKQLSIYNTASRK